MRLLSLILPIVVVLVVAGCQTDSAADRDVEAPFDDSDLGLDFSDLEIRKTSPRVDNRRKMQAQRNLSGCTTKDGQQIYCPGAVIEIVEGDAYFQSRAKLAAFGKLDKAHIVESEDAHFGARRLEARFSEDEELTHRILTRVTGSPITVTCQMVGDIGSDACDRFAYAAFVLGKTDTMVLLAGNADLLRTPLAHEPGCARRDRPNEVLVRCDDGSSTKVGRAPDRVSPIGMRVLLANWIEQVKREVAKNGAAMTATDDTECELDGTTARCIRIVVAHASTRRTLIFAVAPDDRTYLQCSLAGAGYLPSACKTILNWDDAILVDKQTLPADASELTPGTPPLNDGSPPTDGATENPSAPPADEGA